MHPTDESQFGRNSFLVKPDLNNVEKFFDRKIAEMASLEIRRDRLLQVLARLTI